jgi:hypothetical protein
MVITSRHGSQRKHLSSVAVQLLFIKILMPSSGLFFRCLFCGRYLATGLYILQYIQIQFMSCINLFVIFPFWENSWNATGLVRHKIALFWQSWLQIAKSVFIQYNPFSNAKDKTWTYWDISIKRSQNACCAVMRQLSLISWIHIPEKNRKFGGSYDWRMWCFLNFKFQAPESGQPRRIYGSIESR